jgi:hypothetical protein
VEAMMMARVHEALTELQDHAKTLCSIAEDDRVLYYRKISPLLLELKGGLRNAPNPLAREKVVELEWNLTILARLGDPDGNSDETHCAWVVELVEGLRAAQGFGTEIG